MQNFADAFSILNLQLVGPFYYIYNSTKKEDKPAYQYHMRWRYFYDTPEFLTLITTHKNPDKNLFHIGYFRDNPVSVDGAYFDNFGNNAILTVCGDNLFCAIKYVYSSFCLGDIYLITATLKIGLIFLRTLLLFTLIPGVGNL